MVIFAKAPGPGCECSPVPIASGLRFPRRSERASSVDPEEREDWTAWRASSSMASILFCCSDLLGRSTTRSRLCGGEHLLEDARWPRGRPAGPGRLRRCTGRSGSRLPGAEAKGLDGVLTAEKAQGVGDHLPELRFVRGGRLAERGDGPGIVKLALQSGGVLGQAGRGFHPDGRVVSRLERLARGSIGSTFRPSARVASSVWKAPRVLIRYTVS